MSEISIHVSEQTESQVLGENASSDIYEKIRNHPKFQEAVASRSRFSWALALIVLIAFYAFILIVAFAPHVLAIPLWTGATTTTGIPIGVGIVVCFWLLTGCYVRRANGEFDATNKEILAEVMQ